jgi:hypothetical protein
MKHTTIKSARRRTVKKAAPSETTRPSPAEIAEESARLRGKAFDILDLLERSLIEIDGITEILLALAAGGPAFVGTPAIFGYLGNNMQRHHTNARGAFNHLHEYLHGKEGAPAAVGERLRQSRAHHSDRRQST